VGECFFWYQLTQAVPDKIHRGIKRLCVCVVHTKQNPYKISHEKVSGKQKPNLKCKKEKGQGD